MSLVIHNTLSGKKETFEPIDPRHVRMYVCGPTVYDMAHVGHARAYVAFDVVLRYLRRRYPRVTYARNYTDIDDKIIKRANERGEAAEALAARFASEFLADMDALGLERPDVAPKVTEHVPQIITMIEELVSKGHAYASKGDVYYAVDSFPAYGTLAKRPREDMEAGARVEPGEQKKNPLDFALWKAAKPGEPFWESPWGKGRPGWHIECSAMAKEHLGVTFDIHGGGKDLIFPHHENEIAQSEAANSAKFARVWMHNGFVNIDNEKMSKSLGNFFTVRDVLKKFDPQALRLFLLSVHYRSPINFSDVALREAEQRVQYLYETLQRVDAALERAPAPTPGPLRYEAVSTLVARFDEAMSDDFNAVRVLGDLSEIFKQANEILASPQDPAIDARTLRAIREALSIVGGVLGLFTEQPAAVLGRIAARREREQGVDPAEIERLIAERAAARKAKDFSRADALRKEIEGKGVVIKDGPTGTTWSVQ